jgi:nicotinamide mononucleotide transporter
MTWIEAVAAFFGFLCVGLTIRRNVLCWPAGLVQVFLYIFIFYDARLYADMVLHIIYVGLSIYGWIYWSRSKRSGLTVVTRMNNIMPWVVIMIAGASIWGYSLATFTDASVPYLDSLVVMASLIAQWLMARKKLESWYFWILADIVAIGIYGYKELYITSGLYLAFLVMAMAGYFAWRKDFRAQKQGADNLLAT